MKRIISVILLIMLCCPAALAEAAPEATQEPETYQAILVSNADGLGMAYEDWGITLYPEIFAATFFVDLAVLNNAFGLYDTVLNTGMPKMYICEHAGEEYGKYVSMIFFFTESETLAVSMVYTTVDLETGVITGYTEENIQDIAATLDGFMTDAQLSGYYLVDQAEFISTFQMIHETLTAE